MQTLMALAIVLPSERLATDCANKRPLVCMRPQVRAKIVGSGKTLWAQGALEGGGVFLGALGRTRVLSSVVLRIG
jgi:hypothetical protein